MIEFIDGPCAWDWLAPSRLRRQAVSGVSSWQHYSTSRFHADLDPVVLHTVDIPDTPFDSGVRVELLPETVVRRWRNLGLEFASGADIRDSGFPETLERSLHLIRTVLPLNGTVAGLCRSLHVLVASDKDVDVSYSDPCLPFSVFVSCPPATEGNRVERLAENIVHEALHLQLTLVESLESLVIHGPGETPVFSPWKTESRSASGLMHAVYVFGNVRCFWKHVATELPGSSSFAQTRIEAIRREMEAARHLLTSRRLTAMGRRLARTLLVSSSRLPPR